jgi:hypothetical protein
MQRAGIGARLTVAEPARRDKYIAEVAPQGHI